MDSGNNSSDSFIKKDIEKFSGKIIAVANQKGGVGKTITAINIAAYFASYGYKTILIDMDPQSNATSGLGFSQDKIKISTYSLIIYSEDPNKAILNTQYENLKLIPSTKQLSGAEVELVTVFKREFRLKEAIQKLEENYDFIIIDCPPSLGLITINALSAAKDILIPIQCSYFALEGVTQLLNIIDMVKRSLNVKLEVQGVFMTMYSRSNLADGIINEIKNYFGDKFYNSIIPKNVRLDESASHGKPIIAFDKNAKGAKAYDELAKEIISRYKNQIQKQGY
ncbi:MAG: AAA family ATPase [Actinobacteria bacterium]|nr:AAA family ATPase [Cyanobacteriota bacterium]MCL5772435.1 AAA family ATPase [Actinomycetota bacterium]